MSGGVDSSVTAHVLKKGGWDVLGITMKVPAVGKAASRPSGTEADSVCRQLRIPHYFVDVRNAFEQLIIQRFRRSYLNGQTPNPCVDCNRLIKFGLLWDLLQTEFGIRFLATGHYARLSRTTDGKVRLGRAKDKAKDQSYFLCSVAAENLLDVILPLGELTKEYVRSVAAQMELSVADKAESMELCFAAQGDYRTVLDGIDIDRPGDITDMQARKIGTHKGIANYTLGQRHGVGFAGGKPLYVGRIDVKNNTIGLGTREEVCRRVVKADQINVLITEELAPGRQARGKIRSYGEPQPCKITEAHTTAMTVEFDKPQFAPTPGQKLVLYDPGDNIIASGTIAAPGH
jgi:tRNA-specific 2-thiouridylase